MKFVKSVIGNAFGIACILSVWWGIEIFFKLFFFRLLTGPESWYETRNFKDISWGEAIFEVPIYDIGFYDGGLTFIAWFGLGAAFFGATWICYRIFNRLKDIDD